MNDFAGSLMPGGGAVDGQAGAELAELSMPYRGKDPSEQEYELAMALVRVGEGQIPDLGAKDYWLRVRNNLAKKMVEQRVAIEATSVVAADMVSSGQSPEVWIIWYSRFL